MDGVIIQRKDILQTSSTQSKYLRSDADDSFSGGLVSTARDEGIFGTYDSNKTDHVWSMGSAYKNASDGSDFGNLYGLAYKHTNNTTGGTMAGSHQIVMCHNGTPKSAMGTGLWTSGTVTASGGNSGNWNTAFGWGDHDGLYLAISGKAADSEKLDAMDSTRFPYALNGSLGTTNTFTGDSGIGSDAIARSMFFRDNGGDFGAIGFHASHNSSSNYAWQMASTSYTNAGSIQARVKNNGTWTSPVTIWNSGNDGASSGLDADKLDAQEGSYYLDYNNFTNTPTIPSAYTHPTHNGDDISVDTGALTGAVVISDLDFNVTTDTLGHVTDANAAISTRTLTLANLGFTGDADANNYTHPSYNGDDFSVDTGALTGATVVSDIDINVTTDASGHVTDANGSVNTRTLTLADLGYTGDTDANNTTARTDEEIRDVAAAQWVNGANTTVVYDDAANTIKINAPAGGVVDGSGVQNYLVKWTDSDTLTDSIMHETNDRVGINVIQTNATFAVSKTGDETMLFEPNVSNGGRNQIGNLDMSNGSYVGMNWNALDHQIQTSGVTKLTISSTTIETPNTIEADGFIKDGGTSSEYLMADGSVTTGGGGGSIDGSGTASMITKWTDADTLEDSNMFENASGDILINSTTIGDGALNVYQTTTDPSLHLVTDDAGASAGPIIKMERDSSSPADDDLLGKIEFVGKDSAGGDVVYGQMQGYIFDTTVGGTLRGGFKLQAIQDTTMYTSLETVGSRGYLYNNWYVNDNLVITSVGELSLETGALINLNGSSGTAGQVLSSNGTSMPTWIDTVHSNTTEGGTGSVNIGNMVKISQSDYTGLATKDADTIYIIVG